MDEEERVLSGAADQPAKAADDVSSSKDTPDTADNQETPADAAQQELAKISAELQSSRTENEELKDKNLRLLAEMENFRQRTERDKAEFAKYAISEFARDILTVADNIRRAIEAVPKEALAANPAVKNLIEGVEVTERALLKVLDRYRVTRFDPLGEPFNPHLHDAMTKVDVPNVPADTVIQVIHAGYMIGERVLRPAAVIVAQGGGTGTQPPKGGNNGTVENIPFGAMQIPDEVLASSGNRARGQSNAEQAAPSRNQEKRRGGMPNEASNEERTAAHFRRLGPKVGGGRQQAGGALNKPAILHKPIISATGGVPAATHPIWEKLVTGQVKHRFTLFAANMVIDRAKREYASNKAAKAKLASELCTFFNRYANLTAADLEMIA